MKLFVLVRNFERFCRETLKCCHSFTRPSISFFFCWTIRMSLCHSSFNKESLETNSVLKRKTFWRVLIWHINIFLLRRSSSRLQNKTGHYELLASNLMTQNYKMVQEQRRVLPAAPHSNTEFNSLWSKLWQTQAQSRRKSILVVIDFCPSRKMTLSTVL